MTRHAASPCQGPGYRHGPGSVTGRAALEKLAEQLGAALPLTKHAMTLAHIKDSRKEVKRVLDAEE